MASETDDYFVSYENIHVHELMLKDEPRVAAYKKFIEENADMFHDKIVVDVGAGTGILSLLAAKSGAKQVFAIEASNISELCEKIVQKNGYSDRIMVIHGPVEEVTLPDNVKADVLISEWMGFYLFHESMLNSLIAARDRFLSSDGIILPSTANLYICPVALKDFHHSHFDYWKNVYGFDFTPALPSAKAAHLSQPQIMTVKSTDCLADPFLLITLDLMFVDKEDIKKIYAMPKFTIKKNDVLHGFAVWFDVEFEGAQPVILQTGPDAASTHWCQTVIILPDALLVSKGESVECRLVLSQDENNSRRYNISIEVPDAAEDEGDDMVVEEEEEVETENTELMVEQTKTGEFIAESLPRENCVEHQHAIQEMIKDALIKQH